MSAVINVSSGRILLLRPTLDHFYPQDTVNIIAIAIIYDDYSILIHSATQEDSEGEYTIIHLPPSNVPEEFSNLLRELGVVVSEWLWVDLKYEHLERLPLQRSYASCKLSLQTSIISRDGLLSIYSPSGFVSNGNAIALTES